MSSLITDSLRRFLGTAPSHTPSAPARPQASEAPEAARGPYNAEVIAVCAQKGGVGKTTTAVNLAAGLALSGKRVLLLDMDPQGHCALSLRTEIPAGAENSGRARLSELLVHRKSDIQQASFETLIPNLRLCPSDKELAQAEGTLAGKIGKEFILRAALKAAKTFAEVIVIDCPPNLGTLTLNALLAADWLLAPCDMSTLSVEGVGDIFTTVETIRDTLGHHLSVLGVVRTRFDQKNKKVNDAVEATLEQWSRHLVPTRVPVNTALAQAQLAGTCIYKHDPDCRGSKAYLEITTEVVRRIGL